MEREKITRVITEELVKLRNILESAPEKIDEIIFEFNSETPGILSAIIEKINHGQKAAAAALLHKVKVRYSYLGFEETYETIGSWEVSLKNNIEIPQFEAHLKKLEKDTLLIIDVLKQVDLRRLDPNTMASTLPLFGKKVLVAEDDEINAMVFEVFIKELGGEIVFANDGFEAVSQAAENTPDLIFMDVHMPYCSGLDAIKTLRSRGVKTPIISLSASSQLNERDESMLAGANDFITKPANRHSIKQALLKHIG